jgi:hypothetical protein
MELPNTYQEWSQQDKDAARLMLAQASGCLTVLLHLHPYLSNVSKLVGEIDTALGIDAAQKLLDAAVAGSKEVA